MPEKTSFFRWQIGLMVTAVFIVLAGFIFYRTSENKLVSDGSGPERKAVTVTNPVTTPSNDEIKREKDRVSLESKLKELESAISDAKAKLNVARNKVTDEEAMLRKEIDEARKAIDEALEKHPLIVAKRAVYEKLQGEKSVISTKQAGLMDSYHKARKDKYDSYNARMNDVFKRMAAEKSAYLKKQGKTRNYSDKDLSDDERSKLREIQKRYQAELQQLQEHKSEYVDDDEVMKGYLASNDAHFDDYEQKEKTQMNILSDISETKLRLQWEDPVISAMNRNLMTKRDRLTQVFSKRSDVQMMIKKITELAMEEIRVQDQIRFLNGSKVDKKEKDVRSLTGSKSAGKGKT